MADSVLDDARSEVATRGLTPAAVAHLTHDALGTIDFAALAPVKKLLKRFFSAEPWTAAEAHALADLVGAGSGWWRYDLDDDFAVEFGWRDDRFRIDIAPRRISDANFAVPVVPEATPNPRSMRFVTGPIHDGPSRWYESAVGVEDPRVARLFADFDAVANVLVGPDFVAVGLHRPDQWEQQLDPILRAVTTEFTGLPTADGRAGPADANDESRRPRAQSARGSSALEQAWKDFGSLRPGVPADLEQIVAATSSPNLATRQVAARLLVGADPNVAHEAWDRLLEDQSRVVRRATVDAMVDAESAMGRPLLERALGDQDAWVRWKALRGLVDLGVGPSRAAVVALAQDPDFRVRLEVARALTEPEHS